MSLNSTMLSMIVTIFTASCDSILIGGGNVLTIIALGRVLGCLGLVDIQHPVVLIATEQTFPLKDKNVYQAIHD